MQIVQYSKSLENNWDEFVLNSKNGGLFHTQKFLSYHPEDKWVDKSILIKNESEIIAVFAACEIENKIVSHAGSNCGGLIVRKNNKLSDTIKIFELIEKHYSQYKSIEFKKHEYIFDVNPSQEIEFIALKNGFQTKEIELSTCISIQNFNYSKNRKEKINRANKKLEINPDDSDYIAFWNILYNNLDSKHNVKPTHTCEEMQLLKKMFPDDINLITAYNEDEIIAGIWAIKINSEVLHTFYIAQKSEQKNSHAVALLIDSVLELAKTDDFKYVNFGVSTENKGETINEGLFNFKESFGGSSVYRLKYEKKIH